MIDIQAGDVVVCVDDDWTTPQPHSPKRGEVFRVSAVYWGGFTDCDDIGASLSLEGKPGAWDADSFQKIDKATDEFTSQIKAIRPIREDA